MDHEKHLLSRIIIERELGPVSEKGITPEFFLNPKARAVFSSILRHNAEYGEPPSLGAIKLDHPNYEFVRPEESFDYLIDQMRESRALAMLEGALTEAVDMHEDRDPAGIMQVLHATLAKISSDMPNSRDVNISATGQERLGRYLALRDADGGLLGYPTGFATLDKATQGYLPEQLNFFVGAPKSGKTTAMLLSSIATHLFGLRPLFFTFEMSDMELAMRMDAFRAGISHERLRAGMLKKVEWDKLETYLRQLESMPDFWMSADSHGASTLTGISAKIDQIKPDVVFIDGMYLLMDEVTGEAGTREALTNITRGLKRMAQNKQLPINATTQVLEWKMDKKKGITSNSIGYCVDEETEILTEQGWKTYDRLLLTDQALTLNHATGISEWCPVEAINVFPAQDRELIRMYGERAGISSLTTAQHRWPVLQQTRRGPIRQWRTTEDLNTHSYIPLAAPYGGFPEVQKYSDNLVELVAWFWTEAGIQASGPSIITQSRLVNNANVDRIRNCLTLAFGPVHEPSIRVTPGSVAWREYQRRGLSEFWISKSATKQLTQYAPNRVPTNDFLLSLTKAQLELFINVSMLADNNGMNALSQKDHDAAEAFQFACVLSGKATTLTHSNPRKTTPYGMWHVQIKTRMVATPVAAARQNKGFSIEVIPHTGIIWCPTTSNHSWLARRDGVVYFTGNSSSFAQDADNIFGMEKTDDPNIQKLKVVISRNSPPRETYIQWDWETGNFEELHENPFDTPEGGWSGEGSTF